MAPFLFKIVLDYILRNCVSPDYGLTITPRQSRRIPAVTVTDLDFADDLALLFNTIQEAQSLLNDLEVAAEKVGLCMNSSKTKFMTINIDSEKASIKSKGGHSLEHVDDFKYLGSYIADSQTVNRISTPEKHEYSSDCPEDQNANKSQDWASNESDNVPLGKGQTIDGPESLTLPAAGVPRCAFAVKPKLRSSCNCKSLQCCQKFSQEGKQKIWGPAA
ncbi:hypothetical protein ACHWQZ_G000587 [Mnemiopsis leidyi]